MRVLLVEDDELLGNGIETGLKTYGYAIDWVKDGALAEHALKTESSDLVILDLGLPKLDGLEVLKRFRGRGNQTPVLILTARETTQDRVLGLDSGADDYMVKPFDLDELCARARALLRRSSGRAEAVLSYGNIEIDPASLSVHIDGELVNFPRREFALLHKLLDNSGRVLSRDQLMESVYGWQENLDSNVLEVHVHNLRKKLGTKFIRTIRGVGYMVDKQE